MDKVTEKLSDDAVYGKICTNYYKTNLVYPSAPECCGEEVRGETKKFCCMCGKSLADLRSKYHEEKVRYYEDQNRLNAQFQTDALTEVGLLNGVVKHPKADKAWMMAWEDGHSGGMGDVLSCLGKYADLLLND